MNRFLLYSRFNKLNPNFYTLVGGVVTTDFNLSKPPIETWDCVNDSRLYIKGSGVETSEISCSGVFDNDLPRETIGKILSTVQAGDIIPSRLRNDDITILGDFFYSSFNMSESYDAPNSFSLTLISHGVISSLQAI